MADKRISDLAAGAALDGSELFESEQAAASVKLTGAQLAALLTGGSLVYSAVCGGSGAPAHTPLVSFQTYTDTDDGTEYSWYSAAWH